MPECSDRFGKDHRIESRRLRRCVAWRSVHAPVRLPEPPLNLASELVAYSLWVVGGNPLADLGLRPCLPGISSASITLGELSGAAGSGYPKANIGRSGGAGIHHSSLPDVTIPVHSRNGIDMA